MRLPFDKFDGAGNDFILLDARRHDPRLSAASIARLCHRRFGVGADGLMTLHERAGYDFEMRYYNSDGRLGSMCGNGGRCITAFARRLGIVPAAQDGTYRFLGYDGEHAARLLSWDGDKGVVTLKMRDVDTAEACLRGWRLDTGSPHYVEAVRHLEDYDVVGHGRALRHDADTFPQGVNVDFVEAHPDGTLMVRTYERGVEDETYSCGTGVTAAALVHAMRSPSGGETVRVATRGGDFEVSFGRQAAGFANVWLTGPGSHNFEGEVRVAP